MKTLVDITQKRNVAVMIVTHDENVVKYGTAKYYMEDGKIRKYE
jgi:ABC-type lipoprotein export system ATPase subunit